MSSGSSLVVIQFAVRRQTVLRATMVPAQRSSLNWGFVWKTPQEISEFSNRIAFPRSLSQFPVSPRFLSMVWCSRISSVGMWRAVFLAHVQLLSQLSIAARRSMLSKRDALDYSASWGLFLFSLEFWASPSRDGRVPDSLAARTGWDGGSPITTGECFWDWVALEESVGEEKLPLIQNTFSQKKGFFIDWLTLPPTLNLMLMALASVLLITFIVHSVT